MQVRGLTKRTEEVGMHSLGSPKALTQFLYQRLSLPFFSDVGEELSENTTQHLNNYLLQCCQTLLKSVLNNLVSSECSTGRPHPHGEAV